MSPRRAVFLIGLLAALAAAGGLRAGDDGPVVERGTFVLHLYKRPTGKETYEIRRDGDDLVLKADYENTDRGRKEPLTATLRLRDGRTPGRFEVKGMTSRFTQIDSEVRVEGRTAAVREGKNTTHRPVPDRFFVAGGFAPVSVQMMLVRDWERGQVAGPLETLPGGSVTIEKRGRDTVEVAGKRVELDRYSVGGVVWGRETLWFDPERKLVAAVTVDAEFNRFEAIREGFEPALPTFVARSAEDGMAVLAGLADRFSPKRTGPLAIVGATLIDGTGAEPVEDAVVIVDGDRIAAAGPRARVAIPPGAQVLEARGQAVLPGLWEMHAHFTQVEWGPIYLAAGVTTAQGLRQRVRVHHRRPRCHRRGARPRPPLARGRDHRRRGADDHRRRHRHDVRAGRGAGPALCRRRIPADQDLQLAQARARRRHRPGGPSPGAERDRPHPAGHGGATGHRVGHGPDQPHHLDPERHDGERARRVEEESRVVRHRSPGSARSIPVRSGPGRFIGFLKEHGTVIDPTIAIYELTSHPPGRAPNRASPRSRRSWPVRSDRWAPRPARERDFDALLPEIRRVVGALHKAGVPIVAGTDQAVPGHSLHRELELYVQAGMTPMEAIRSATIVPARAMKLDREAGTIEAGKRADLILVAGRPDREISDIRKVKTVIAAGRAYDCAELWKSVGFRP